jgi:hypothetical protein
LYPILKNGFTVHVKTVKTVNSELVKSTAQKQTKKKYKTVGEKWLRLTRKTLIPKILFVRIVGLFTLHTLCPNLTLKYSIHGLKEKCGFR